MRADFEESGYLNERPSIDAMAPASLRPSPGVVVKAGLPLGRPVVLFWLRWKARDRIPDILLGVLSFKPITKTTTFLVTTKFLLKSLVEIPSVKGARFGRFDSVSLAGIAVFGALSVVLTTLSQALVLSFPLIPYLQFDLGEVAILLAFFIFGPVPAIVSSFIEFATLMVIGQNVAYFGPELKLIAILSSFLGIWLGTTIVSRMANPSIGRAVGAGTILGMIFRAAVMTVPNYLLIVLLFGLNGPYGIISFVSGPFKAIGVTITDANALLFILGLTAVFNVLQLLFVSSISYLVIRLPQVQGTRAAGRRPWIVGYMQHSDGGKTDPVSTLSPKASP